MSFRLDLLPEGALPPGLTEDVRCCGQILHCLLLRACKSLRCRGENWVAGPVRSPLPLVRFLTGLILLYVSVVAGCVRDV